MDVSGRWRGWFPIPTEGEGPKLGRWLLLEGNRHAVTAALLSTTFVTILVIGTIWTFEMQQLLTETAAVQTVLNTFLSGIILLVSIVVSINSIVLSYDIASITSQEDRVEGALEFRRELDQLTDTEQSPTDPNSFLHLMADVIRQYARDLGSATEEADVEATEDIGEHIESVVKTTDYLERSLDRVGGAEFGALWIGLEIDYPTVIDQSRRLGSTSAGTSTETADERFEDLIRVFELFETGKQYFKTLYYNREISALSRTLLLISLPAILITASAILAINANLLPNVWMFGLPPLLTFVAATFTIALAPFLVLTAFMLRVTTVALRTATAGPFVLRS